MKFLIIKTSSLGDIIHSFPVISYLKQKFPNCIIDWVAEEQCAELIESHPHIDKTLRINTKSWRKSLLSRQTWQEIAAFRKKIQKENYDCIFDLQGNIKSGLLTFLANGNFKVGFGFKTVPEWPNLFFNNKRFDPAKNGNIRQDYLSIARQYFNDPSPFCEQPVFLKTENANLKKIESLLSHPVLCKEKKIMVCPGSTWINKQMTTSTLLSLLKQISASSSCSFLFVWGTQEELTIADELHQHFSSSLLVDKMPLPALQNLMHRMDLVIAMDSLPLHLAGTTSTPTFGIFGPSSSSKYKPAGTIHHAFQGVCPYGRTFEKRCPILRSCPTGACIREVSANDVFEHYNTER